MIVLRFILKPDYPDLYEVIHWPQFKLNETNLLI